jgi:hypothetical protein
MTDAAAARQAASGCNQAIYTVGRSIGSPDNGLRAPCQDQS